MPESDFLTVFAPKLVKKVTFLTFCVPESVQRNFAALELVKMA